MLIRREIARRARRRACRRDCGSRASAADPNRNRWHCGIRRRTTWRSSAPAVGSVCDSSISCDSPRSGTRSGLPTSGWPSAYRLGSLNALPQAPATLKPVSPNSYATRTRGLVTESSPSGLSTRTPAWARKPEARIDAHLGERRPGGARQLERRGQHEAAAEIELAVARAFLAQPVDAIGQREQVRELLRAGERGRVAREIRVDDEGGTPKGSRTPGAMPGESM